MSGIIVVARNPISSTWLKRFDNEDVRRKICAFRGFDGSCWLELPSHLRLQLIGDEFNGVREELEVYLNELKSKDIVTNVFRARSILQGELKRGWRDSSCGETAIGYDLCFTNDFEEYYSVLLHAIGQRDVTAQFFEDFSGPELLLKSIDSVNEAVRMLNAEETWPSWLEPSYRDRGTAHLLAFEIQEFL